MRVHDIDVAKGIGIILIIGLHTGFHQPWLVQFEMPLFFLLSGIFFSAKSSFFDFIIKRINTLLIPYLFFETPAALYNFAFFLTHSNITIEEAFLQSSIPTTTWFLLALFEGQILAYFILRSCKKTVYRILCAVIIIYAGYLWHIINIPNYAYIGSACSLTGYLISGSIFKTFLLKSFKSSTNALLGLAGLTFCFICYYLHPIEVFYRDNIIGQNFFYAVTSALSGALGVLFIAKLITHNKILEYYGRNSLIILGSHLYFIVSLNRLIPITITQSVIAFLATVIVVIPIIHLLRKYLPWLCGAKPLLSFNIKTPKTATLINS